MAIFWSNVQIALGTYGTAMPIVSLTKANPAVLTYTPGVDPANGDYHLLLVQGMYQLDRRIVRVAGENAGADNFQCEGIDSTGYGTFSLGTTTPVTFSTTLGTITDVSASGGAPQFADITTIHDSVRKQAPTINDPLTLTFESIYDPTDAALIALKAAADTISERAIKITFANGWKLLFNGYVSAPLIPTGSKQDVVKTQIVLTSSGRAQVYTT